MGVAVGDYDGDGFPDVLVTQYNGVILYHNNGTFTDVTRKAGLSVRLKQKDLPRRAEVRHPHPTPDGGSRGRAQPWKSGASSAA